MALFDIGKYYNFSVYANTVIGMNITSARLVSIMDYTTALKFGNIVLTHAQVLPYLPSGSLTDQTKYTYYLFTLKDGNNIIVADTWIIPNSVIPVTTTTNTLILYDVNPLQLGVIRDQLRLMGISFDLS